MMVVILPMFSPFDWMVFFMIKSSRDICDVIATCIFLQKVIIHYALHEYNYG